MPSSKKNKWTIEEVVQIFQRVAEELGENFTNKDYRKYRKDNDELPSVYIIYKYFGGTNTVRKMAGLPINSVGRKRSKGGKSKGLKKDKKKRVLCKECIHDGEEGCGEDVDKCLEKAEELEYFEVKDGIYY